MTHDDDITSQCIMKLNEYKAVFVIKSQLTNVLQLIFQVKILR